MEVRQEGRKTKEGKRAGAERIKHWAEEEGRDDRSRGGHYLTRGRDRERVGLGVATNTGDPKKSTPGTCGADMLKNREKRGKWVPNGLALKLLDAGRTRLVQSPYGVQQLGQSIEQRCRGRFGAL